MNQRKWIAGPWFVVGPHPDGKWTIQDKDGGGGNCIAQQYGPASMETAHLIAAAPDLYEVLARAQEELRLLRLKDTGVVYDTMLRVDMDRALAKARGEP